jgi:hypothetical protein
MIWCNEKFTAKSKDFEWGKLTYIAMGEEGRGRKEIRIPIQDGLELVRGLNSLSIGTTKSGRPRIDHRSDSGLYLLISTYGGYTRRGDGYISCMPVGGGDFSGSEIAKPRNCFKVLDEGNGADGDAGRIGTWEVYVLECVSPNCFLRIRYSGGSESELLYIDENYNIVNVGLNVSGQFNMFTEKTGIVIPYYDYSEELFGKEWKYLGLNR